MSLLKLITFVLVVVFWGGQRVYLDLTYSQARSSVPPKNTLMNLLFKS